MIINIDNLKPSANLVTVMLDKRDSVKQVALSLF